MSCVLDASALLAGLRMEDGAELVRTALGERCYISAVNWAEVLARMPSGSADRDDSGLAALIAPGSGTLEVVAFDERQARATAEIKRNTTGVALSLGDRACLAL